MHFVSLFYPFFSRQVLNKYIQKLGVSSDWSVTDVIGLDPELLDWIPKPVKAFILLFPISESVSFSRFILFFFWAWYLPLFPQYEKHRSDEDSRLKANPPADLPDDLFYMKQTIHNACGTIALVHSIANNSE